MIDSHCHLGIDDFKQDIEGALKRAKEQGISHILTVACDYNQIDDLLHMAKYEGVCTAFGIHPENAEHFDFEKTKKIFETYPFISALGEIGLDYFYNLDTKEIQQKVFYQQIELASLLKKPIIIHARDSNEDIMHILDKSYKNNLLSNQGVMHCFCGDYTLAKKALDVGLYISVSGILTFKNADYLRDIVKKIPLDRLLVETDSPYLAPHPFRGKQNEPSFVVHTLKMLAKIKEIDISVAEAETTKNFFNLFMKESRV